MNFDVFISYPHQDKATADAACAKLEAEGIRCWIAPRDVPPGAEWATAIVDAIDHCRGMVLIFSSSSNQSRQIYREVQRAFDREVPVVPFRIENIIPEKSLAYYLGPVHWLDALTPPLEQHLQKLAESLKALVQVKTVADDERDYRKEEEEIRRDEAKRRVDGASVASECAATAGVAGQRPEPHNLRQRSRRALLSACGLGVVLVGSVGVWLAGTQWAPVVPQPERSAPPPIRPPPPAMQAPTALVPLSPRPASDPPASAYPDKIDLNPSTPFAMTNLGYRYQSGIGIPVDYDLALKWFKKAADAGSVEAWNALGFRYHDGIGTPRDFDEARKWWEKAADQNNAAAAAAQLGLGILYELGQGVPQDYDQARKWYEKSAAHGNIGAPWRLGRFYQFGWGVPQDYAQARKWFQKANAQGYNTMAQKSLKEIEEQ
jgi:hypothetical protein